MRLVMICAGARKPAASWRKMNNFDVGERPERSQKVEIRSHSALANEMAGVPNKGTRVARQRKRIGTPDIVS